jgi:hypothetical protein
MIVCVLFLFTLDVGQCQKLSIKFDSSEESCLKDEEGNCKLGKDSKSKEEDVLVVSQHLKYILEQA